MADTRPDVVIPPATWTNVYAATGITVGTAVEMFNKGTATATISTAAAAPASSVGIPLYPFTGEGGEVSLSIGSGENGLWAYCPQGTRIVVREVLVSSGGGASSNVTVLSSALPTGAATAANQATEISSLSTIASNTSGTNATGVTAPSGATGFLGWLSSIYNNTLGLATASGQASLLTSTGTDATGVTPPTGAVGVRGWLSGIYNTLTQGIPLAAGTTVAVTGIAAASDNIVAFNLTSASGTTEGVQRTTIALNGAGSTLIQLSSLGTGGQLQCYGSVDGSTYWQLKGVQVNSVHGQEYYNQPSSGNIGNPTQFLKYDTTGLASFQIRVNALTSGTITGTARTSPGPTSIVDLNQPVNQECLRQTFRALTVNNTSFPTSPTNIFTLHCGNSTVVRLVSVHIEGVATSAAYVDVQLQRSTIADTGGTSAAPLYSGGFDTVDLGRASNGYVYTANPSANGGTTTTIEAGKLYLPAVSPVSGPVVPLVWEFGRTHSKEAILSGTQQFAINLGGVSLPAGASLTIHMTWTEEAI